MPPSSNDVPARGRLIAGAMLLLVATTSLDAQSVRGVAHVADSIAAAGDSARAYQMLEAAVRENRQDAAAWHQLGLLSWSMAKRGRSPSFIKDAKIIRLLDAADSSLHIATKLAPDSARYWLSLARFNLGSGLAVTRYAASGQSKNALEAATKTGDNLMLAAAADEVGMFTWRRYEPVANRMLVNTGAGVDLSAIQRNKAVDYLYSLGGKIQPPTGESDYLQALEQFRIAEQADPTSQRYSRHLFMALGERGQWEEMRSLARQRIAKYPLDYQSWLAMGLAAHRMADDAAAKVAFDSAEALMDDLERERMTQLTRILRPVPQKDKRGRSIQAGTSDAKSFQSMEEGARRGLEAMYWMMSDPLALTSENEYRLEFLSRVAWADMRWTDEDVGLRGADTDRGDIYIRYGPPKDEITVGASGNLSVNTVTLAWVYNPDLVFFFDLIPGFATARTMFADKDYVDQVRAAVPVMWDNVPSTRLIDTIPIRIARFRAAGDSMDAVVAARVPVDSLVRGLQMNSVRVDVDFRLFDQFVKVRGVESVQSSFPPDSVAQPLSRAWTRRLGPGINVVRVEALQLDSRRAARAMSRVDPRATAGFDMSDVLLGNKPTLRNESEPARRWTDVVMTPNAGVYDRQSPIGLVWEIYDLVAREGTAKYRVSITVQRTDRAAFGAAGRLFDALGRTLGRAQTRRDNLTYTFDRTVAPAAAVVELLSLDLADYPPGAYRLRVEVLDTNANRRTSREAEFRIQ